MRPTPRRARDAARPSRVFLHVGAPTPGAGYLRATLSRHRRRLTRAGVLYPGSRLGADDGHLAAVLDVLDLTDDEHPRARGAWEQLAQATRDWRRGTVVVSHELLADADEEQVQRVITSFGGAEVHVVHTAADLARQVPAAWEEWVRHGGTATFATYVARLADPDAHRFARVFWRSHDLERVLHRWSTFVPAERVHLVTVPAGASPADAGPALWERFARTVGIDPVRFPGPADPSAVPLSLPANEVLRLLNVAAGQDSGPELSAAYRPLLRDVHGPLPAVPAERAAWVCAEADRMVRAVKSGGYDVRGDVIDLLPAPDAFATGEEQVLPATADVVRVQTALLAASVRGSGEAGGPAGSRRRALRTR